MRTRSMGSLFTGFFIGGLIGATIALLSAPQSGMETRTMLRDRGMQLRDKAAETAEDTRKRANDLIQRTKERASSITGRSPEKTMGEMSDMSSSENPSL